MSLCYYEETVEADYFEEAIYSLYNHSVTAPIKKPGPEPKPNPGLSSVRQ